MVLAGTMGFAIVICLLAHVKLTIHLLQLPLVFLLLMYFWVMWSIWLSPLSAISRDFSKLIGTLTTPFFWLSGVLFQLEKLPHPLRTVMNFNPVTWGCRSVRDCFIDHKWIWQHPKALGCYLFICLVVTILAMHSYNRLHKEVPDVL
jgi:teichoic acid transport system permease protein